MAALLLLKYSLRIVNYSAAVLGSTFSATLEMLIVVGTRYPVATVTRQVLVCMHLVLKYHQPHPRVIPGMLPLVKKYIAIADQGGVPTTYGENTACTSLLMTILQHCKKEQLGQVVAVVAMYAKEMLHKQARHPVHNILCLLVKMLIRVQLYRKSISMPMEHLIALYVPLGQLADTWTRDLFLVRAELRYTLVDVFVRLFRLGVACPQETDLHVQALCVGMLTLNKSASLLRSVKRLFFELCSPRTPFSRFVLKQTFISRLLRTSTNDARRRRDILEILDHIVHCNQGLCFCHGFTEGTCSDVLDYCLATRPTPEASALCQYRNVAIVATITRCVERGVHKPRASARQRANVAAFLKQLPTCVCVQHGLKPVHAARL